MEAPTTQSSQSRGVTRILGKLDTNLEEGNFYEAHQNYKTLCYRLSNQKKYVEAINILHSGACKLLEKQQIESGADLAMTLLDVLLKIDSEQRLQFVDKLSSIHALLPPDSLERHHFVSKSIKCTKSENNTAGAPDFHKALAQTLWKEKRHAEARYHFLYCSDGESCGRFLIEYHHDCGGSDVEIDLFIAQMVLQYLCLKNITAASVTFYAYVNNHPNVAKGKPFLLPLLNFLWFLLSAVKEGKIAVFSVLCEKYQPTLSRDPVYNTYLDKIGQNFFGVPAPPKQGGFLGGILGSLLSGLNDDDEDSPAPPQSNQPSTSTRAFETSDLD